MCFSCIAYQTLLSNFLHDAAAYNYRNIFNNFNRFNNLVLYCFRDDSTPGAIAVPKTDISKLGSCPDDPSLKRFLQCPGMCRVDVLKKFVRNKYNVDTSKFYVST